MWGTAAALGATPSSVPRRSSPTWAPRCTPARPSHTRPPKTSGGVSSSPTSFTRWGRSSSPSAACTAPRSSCPPPPAACRGARSTSELPAPPHGMLLRRGPLRYSGPPGALYGPGCAGGTWWALCVAGCPGGVSLVGVMDPPHPTRVLAVGMQQHRAHHEKTVYKIKEFGSGFVTAMCVRCVPRAAVPIPAPCHPQPPPGPCCPCLALGAGDAAGRGGSARSRDARGAERCAYVCAGLCTRV